MTEKLPAPPVPADCDLRAFKDLPLEAATLRDARIVDVTTGDEFKAAVLLWAAAWHQVPAGSLPDDDVQLSKYAGYGRVVTEWGKVRTGALYGFVKCSDGRLYHRFLCSKALAAWDARREHAWRKECDRIRKENKTRTENGEPSRPMPTKPARLASDPFAVSSGTDVRSIGNEKPSDGIPAENALKGNEGKGNEGIIPVGTQSVVSPKADPWAEVYAKGREILGDGCGATISQLRSILQKPNKVLGKLHDAADKAKPREWLYAFIRDSAPPGTHVSAGTVQ